MYNVVLLTEYYFLPVINIDIINIPELNEMIFGWQPWDTF